MEYPAILVQVALYARMTGTMAQSHGHCSLLTSHEPSWPASLKTALDACVLELLNPEDQPNPPYSAALRMILKTGDGICVVVCVPNATYFCHTLRIRPTPQSSGDEP